MNFEIQPGEFIARNRLTHLQGEIISRICRYNKKWKDKKDQIEDLKKIKHEVDMILEFEYGEEEK
jgi:hypothetical protein